MSNQGDYLNQQHHLGLQNNNSLNNESIEQRIMRRIGEIQRELDGISEERKQTLWGEMTRLRKALDAIKGA